MCVLIDGNKGTWVIRLTKASTMTMKFRLTGGVNELEEILEFRE